MDWKTTMRRGFDHWVGKIRWRRAWQLTPVCLPGEFYGQRSLACYDWLSTQALTATWHGQINNTFKKTLFFPKKDHVHRSWGFRTWIFLQVSIQPASLPGCYAGWYAFYIISPKSSNSPIKYIGLLSPSSQWTQRGAISCSCEVGFESSSDGLKTLILCEAQKEASGLGTVH